MDEALPFESVAGTSPWIDELPDGLVVCAPDGLITQANQRLCTMSGYRRSELIGMPVDHLVPSDRRPAHPELRNGFVTENRTRPMGHPGADLRPAQPAVASHRVTDLSA